MEDAVATDIIAQEARVQDVDNASNAKRYLMNWAQSFKGAGYQSVLSGYHRHPGEGHHGALRLLKQASLIVMIESRSRMV